MSVVHVVDKGRLFDEIAINYTAAEATGVQSYRSQSKNLAMVARILYLGDFQEADLLDVACGFGITALAAASHNPRSITSIDPSESLTSIARMIFQEDQDIAIWLESRGARQLLGSAFQRTVEYLMSLRNGFREYFFCHQKKPLTILQTGLMEFQPENKYDVVILNNALHWVVTQIRKQKEDPDAPETVRAALVEALRKVRSFLNVGGVFAFLSPKVFVRLSDLEREDYLAAHWSANHPIMQMLNSRAREIFKNEKGISSETSGAPPVIYHQSEMAQVAKESGFRLVSFLQFEESLLVPDALDYFKLLIPINLGDIEALMVEKVRVVNEAARQIEAEVAAMPQNHYIHDQQHIFAFTAE